MRLSPTLLLTLVLLTGAGCFKAAEPTVLPEQPERESENMVGDLEITTVEIQREFVLNEFASCTVDIAYPSFQANELPGQLRLQIEHELAHFIAVALGSDAEINSPGDLEGLADTYLATCQAEITAEYNDLSAAGEELFTNLKRSVEIVYTIKLNQDDLLSLGLEEYSYSGGAHPNQSSLYVTADHAQGKLLTLGDLIAPEHLKVFVQYEKAKLLTDNRENLYPESADDFDVLIEDQLSLSPEEQLDLYGRQKNFYLTPTSIITYYNSYDIAPYAAGPIFVEIPYADILDYIATDGPLVLLVEKL